MTRARSRRTGDQLFAEACHRYRAGVPWWPDRDFEREYAASEQEQRREAHPWEDLIAAYLKDTSAEEEITIPDILRTVCELDPGRQNAGHVRNIAAILRHLGYEQKRLTSRRFWTKPHVS